jgi:hypothetical protein
VDSVKDAPHARCPKTASLPEVVEKVKLMQDLQLGIQLNALVSL